MFLLPDGASGITAEMLDCVRAEIRPEFEQFVRPLGLAHAKTIGDLTSSDDGKVPLAAILYFHLSEIESHRRHIMHSNDDEDFRGGGFTLLLAMIHEIVLQDLDRFEEDSAAEPR